LAWTKHGACLPTLDRRLLHVDEGMMVRGRAEADVSVWKRCRRTVALLGGPEECRECRGVGLWHVGEDEDEYVERKGGSGAANAVALVLQFGQTRPVDVGVTHRHLELLPRLDQTDIESEEWKDQMQRLLMVELTVDGHS
jgi:hypothetical protein